MFRRKLLAGALAALASACAPSLSTFNRFTPRDAGARRVLRNAAYAEGARRSLDLYAPAAPAAAPLPVIVFIYGGSWNSGAKEDYAFVGDAFAARGFLTAIPDYRVSPHVFPSFLEDCAAAVAWMHTHAAEFGGDPGRIVLIGHSAGAYNAVMLGLDGACLRAAGAPASAIKGVGGLAGPYDFYPFDVDSTRAAFGQAPDPQATQPVHFARAGAPPLFLAWGADDTLVGRKNIDHLTAAQRAAGGRVEAHVYLHTSHVGILLALSRPFRGRAPVLADITAFARAVTAPR